MYITVETLDDLLHHVIPKLLKSKNRINPTKGSATELTGVLFKITKPRARLSRTERKGTLFSCLGELLWYLAKSNDVKFISYYVKDYEKWSDDGKTVYGAYGPRMFNMRGNNQVANVIALLKRKPDSRQAVIQLFDSNDIVKKHKDIPCTCTLQFMIRGERLHMFTHMRSNDAFIGLPHDIFTFTMLQEIIARSLRVELGKYNHAVGSLHLYENYRDGALQYVKEGWQSTTIMPPMPTANPWSSIFKVVKAERAIRSGRKINISDLRLDPYWRDLVRLLQIYWHSKKGESNEIVRLKNKMSVDIYDPYIEKKKQTAHKHTMKARSK
ncbi:MAG: thymidylate synthase [Nitrospiria bacterium]